MRYFLTYYISDISLFDYARRCQQSERDRAVAVHDCRQRCRGELHDGTSLRAPAHEGFRSFRVLPVVAQCQPLN